MQLEDEGGMDIGFTSYSLVRERSHVYGVDILRTVWGLGDTVAALRVPDSSAGLMCKIHLSAASCTALRSYGAT